MRAVNLLPRELAAERKQLPSFLPLAGAAAVPVISVILVVVGYSRAHATVTSETAQLAAVQATVPAAATTAPSPDAGLIADRSARLAALQTVLAKQTPWDVTFADLSRLVPAGVWLTSLTGQSPTPEGSPPAAAPAPTTGSTSSGTTFTINGSALTEADLALLLQRLQLLPALANLSLTTVSSTPLGQTTVLSFALTASLQPAGTPPATNAPPTAAPTTTTTVPATTTTTTTTPTTS